MSFPFYAISLDDFETRPKIQFLINFVARLRNFLGYFGLGCVLREILKMLVGSGNTFSCFGLGRVRVGSGRDLPEFKSLG